MTIIEQKNRTFCVPIKEILKMILPVAKLTANGDDNSGIPMIAGISAVRMRLHVVSKSGRLRIWLGWRISLASKQLGWDGFIIP